MWTEYTLPTGVKMIYYSKKLKTYKGRGVVRILSMAIIAISEKIGMVNSIPT
jgi:hypothetical protein